jgi:hypothetical protein
MTDFTDVGISHELKLQHAEVQELGNDEIIKGIWWFEDGKWEPQGIDRGPVYAMLRKGTDQSPEGYLNLFEIISTNTNAPLLVTDQGFVVKKDISAGGFVGSNQGELWLGSGRNDQVDVPKIVLGNSGVSRLEGGGPLDVPEIPSGIQFPAGENGQLFIYTPTSYLYKHNGSTWVPLGPTSNYAGYFDTLFIRKANAQDPAHLDVEDINIHGHLDVGDTVTSDLNPNPNLDLGNYNNPWASVVTSSLWVKSAHTQFGVTAGDVWNGSGYDVYLHPQNPANGGICLGTGTYPFKWINATYVFTDIINSVSDDGIRFVDDIWISDGSLTKDIRIKRSAAKTLKIFHSQDSENTIYTASSIFPLHTNYYHIGTNVTYWVSVWANYLKYHTSSSQFDSLDDLNLVKNYATKKEMKNGVEVDVIDFEQSFPFLIDDHGFKDIADVNGFLLGCVKQLVLRVEALETKLGEVQAG